MISAEKKTKKKQDPERQKITQNFEQVIKVYMYTSRRDNSVANVFASFASKGPL